MIFQSKQSIESNSPQELILEGISQDDLKEFGFDSINFSLAEQILTKNSPNREVRSTPKRLKFNLEISNKDQVAQRLDLISKEFLDLSLAHTKDTEDILLSLSNLCDTESSFIKTVKSSPSPLPNSESINSSELNK